MNRKILRIQKDLNGPRWEAMRHNRKNENKILLFPEKYILSNLKPGLVFVPDIFSLMYEGILDITYDASELVANVLLINCYEFKYKEIKDIVDIICSYKKNLHILGRIIVNLNTMFIIYDRLNVSKQSLIADIQSQLADHGLITVNFFTSKAPLPGYGDLFLKLQYE